METLQIPRRRKRGWLLAWFIPALWLANSYISSNHPGDEYGLFFIGAFAGTWWLIVFGDDGSMGSIMIRVQVIGTVVMALLAILLVLLRASRRLWGVLLLMVATAVCATSLLSYPSLQRAVSKNGSITAYVCFSINFGMYIATIVTLIIAGILRLIERRPRPGECQLCCYDLTGNTTGRCPECGTAITAGNTSPT